MGFPLDSMLHFRIVIRKNKIVKKEETMKVQIVGSHLCPGCREILEETGLQVKNLRYCASQPWPYPSVLMVGYVATYESGELSLQRSELRKGQWFKRKALPQIPGKVSLARQLIDRWIEQKL